MYILAREELESKENNKFLIVTTHTKQHARRRERIEQQLLENIVASKNELGDYVELVVNDKWPGRFVPKMYKVLGGTKTQSK